LVALPWRACVVHLLTDHLNGRPWCLWQAQINIKANHYSGRNVAEEVKARAAVEAVTQQVSHQWLIFSIMHVHCSSPSAGIACKCRYCAVSQGVSHAAHVVLAWP
jgi:hypothetical protein